MATQHRAERTERAVEETGSLERTPNELKDVTRQEQRQVTELTRRATDETEVADRPKKGDQYRCDECGMEIEVTADCGAMNHHDAEHGPHFTSCGQEMARV